MTTESLMVHALHRGLLIGDFKILSVGMILDYIMAYDNMHNSNSVDEEEDLTRSAYQMDFNTF